MTKVLVVGAGPVGLTIAAELARYGVSVRIVDKAAARSDKSKALVLWSRSLELLDRAGCTPSFVNAGNKVHATNIVAGGKPIAHVGLDSIASPYPFALMLPQSETERLLEAHLGAVGVKVEREVEATGFVQRDAGVSASLRHGDGREETVDADWLIGCDGAHSTVRHTVGAPFAGYTMKSDWLLADIHVEGAPFPASELAMFMHEDGILALFPIGGTRFRVIADVGTAEGPHPVDPTLAEVQAIATRRGPSGMVLSDPIWLSAFRINERKVSDYRFGRVFLTGDAAHVHSPAGGQGMNTGMQDAFNLAWKLALVTHGVCRESLLDSYSVERSAIGEQVLKAAGRMTAIGVIRNHGAQAIRNFVAGILFGLAPVRHAMADTLSEISIGYSDSPLNGPHAAGLHGPKPGERMAPIAGQSPAGSGGAPKFALFATGDAAKALPGLYPDLLEPALRPAPDAGLWLVRPDGYVALAVRADDCKAVTTYLDALAA